ncbi:Homoserine O-acetyltransferase [uncultured archaeon]|nr:Homoserine O-acetyltransferase [uncultured archaeon]
MNIALHDIQRKAILNDPEWKNGNYYDRGQPKRGLSLARQMGHITYLSHETFTRKFGRDQKKTIPKKKFGIEFEVQSYLDYNGESFVGRFDANSYLYITHAIDHFDLTENGRKTLKGVFKNVKTKILLVSFTSDSLYPPEYVEEVYAGLAEAGVPVVYKKLDLPYGHDAFLVYNNTLGNVLIDFLTENEKLTATK